MRLKGNFHLIITQRFRLTVDGHPPSGCTPLIKKSGLQKCIMIIT